MPIGTGAAMIITALIGTAVGVGSEIVGGIIDKNAADDANRRAMDIWNRQQADEERIRKENVKMNRYDTRFQQQLSLDKLKTEKDAIEYNKRRNFVADTMNLVNANQQLKSTFFNLWDRRAAA